MQALTESGKSTKVWGFKSLSAVDFVHRPESGVSIASIASLTLSDL